MKILIVTFSLLAISLAFPKAKNGIQPRIVGGDIAIPHQFPYQVGIRLIRQKNGVEWTSWCGGALISDQAVITAAHCMDNTVRVLLYLATHNRWEKEEADRVVVEVGKENFRVHEEYSRKFLYNDIALILIPNKVELSDKIATVNLPRRSQTDFDGKFAIATGWGKAGYKIGSSDVLRFVQLRILNNDECLNFGTLKPTQMCTDGKGPKSTCEGDSGGPLVMGEADDSKTIVGIASFGSSSCEEEYPMVYTRVSTYLDWISKHTGISIRN